MICSKCGFVAEENDRFCIRCGTPLVKPEVSAAQEIDAAKADVAAEVSPTITETVERIEEDVTLNAAEEAAEVIPADEAEVKPANDEVNEVSDADAADGGSAEEAADSIPAPCDDCAVDETKAAPIVSAVEPVLEDTEPAAHVHESDEENASRFYSTLENVSRPVDIPDERGRYADTASVLDKPLSVWGYIWRIFLFCIPVLCILPLFIMAFSTGINKNSKHFAAAVLIVKLLGLLAVIVLCLLVVFNTDPVVLSDFFRKFFGITL